MHTTHNEEALFVCNRVLSVAFTILPLTIPFIPCEQIAEGYLVALGHWLEDVSVDIHQWLIDSPAVPRTVVFKICERERNPPLVELEKVVKIEIVIENTLSLFLHAVGRVGEDHISLFAVHKACNVFGLGGVATHEAMLTQLPNFATLAAVLDVFWFRRLVFFNLCALVHVHVAKV